MSLHRIQAKYFVEGPATVDLTALVPIFHRWIQERRVEGLPIDVADYKHVPEGPGILLIGHEADYSFDLGEGRPGLVYRRKRALGDDLRDALRTVLRQALLGCHLLEGEPSLGGLTFRTDEVELRFLDRLRVPNDGASLPLVHDALQAVLKEVYGTADVDVARVETDPRLPFTVRARITDAPGAKSLLRQFEQYA